MAHTIRARRLPLAFTTRSVRRASGSVQTAFLESTGFLDGSVSEQLKREKAKIDQAISELEQFSHSNRQQADGDALQKRRGRKSMPQTDRRPVSERDAALLGSETER